MAVSRLPSRHRRTPLTDVVVPLRRLRRLLLLLLEGWWWSANTNADAALRVSNAALLLPAPEKDGERKDKANSDSAATVGMQPAAAS